MDGEWLKGILDISYLTFILERNGKDAYVEKLGGHI